MATGSTEQHWMKTLEDPDPFHRKLAALNVLRRFEGFVKEGKRAVARMEMKRQRAHH